MEQLAPVEEASLSAHSKQVDLASSNPSLLLRDIAYERIKEAIRMAELRPGEPLSETRISKQLGISRTPVREALHVLAQEGLINVIPGRAVTVAAPSIQEIIDAIHVRSILEPEVVRLATRAISSEDIDLLFSLLDELEESAAGDDRAAWSQTDNLFHETLNTACPNQLLGELSLQIRNRISFLSIDVEVENEQLQARTAEHRLVLERMKEGDAGGASDAMRDHIDMLRESILNRLSHSY